MSQTETRKLIGHLRVVEPCRHGRLAAHGWREVCPGGWTRPTDIDELTEILAREGWTVAAVSDERKDEL